MTTGESKGDPAILDPEQLLLMAASSCQMLWFLHLAAKARIDVVAYDDDAAGAHAGGRSRCGSPNHAEAADRGRGDAARSASQLVKPRTSTASSPTG